MKASVHKGLIPAIILAALGYFVDIYDLILFLVVRTDSLRGVGITDPAAITREGEFLLSVQMIGLLLGGIVWGILGDRQGRLSVLFGSIMMYSVANIANAFVNDVYSYAVLRFIAGIGLAGELGAGVTLVTELMSVKQRGWGATIVATFGLLGAVVAGVVARIDWGLDYPNWRIAYLVGGSMGLGLLLLRIGVFESGMFQEVKEKKARRGDLLLVLGNTRNLLKYLNCILIGIPIWYVVGILIAQSREFSRDLGVVGTIEEAYPVMLAYVGLAIGDLTSGVISQLIGSRKRTVLVFLIANLVLIFHYLTLSGVTSFYFYTVCFLLGFTSGYWAVFVIIAAEQFGTNIRATVTTTVPNFVRGSLALVTLLFQFFRTTLDDRIYGAMIVGLIVLGISFAALHFMEETYGKDLNYIEE